MGEFNIKNASNFTLRPIGSDEGIELDYLNNRKLDMCDNEKYIANEGSLIFNVDVDRSKELSMLNDNEIANCNMKFTFKNTGYSVTINNIPGKYVSKCPELVGEYCRNIIYKLAEEGHIFADGEIIDFQKYLV